MNSEWQPIETAPQDGRRIIGCYVPDGDAAVVRWKAGHGDWHGYWNLDVCGSYAEDGEWWPTHWMPLPEPPK